MSNPKMNYNLPLKRAHPQHVQVAIAIDGGDSSGLKDADGIKLNDLGYLVRENRLLRQDFTLISLNKEHVLGTMPPHAVKHLLPQLRSFNPTPKKEPEPERSVAERMRRTREMLRSWGCIVHNRDGAGRIIDVDDG